MKQTPLKRKGAMKRSQPRRDWTAAREKVEREIHCRCWGPACRGQVEAAHVIGREHDRLSPQQEGFRPKGSPVVWPVKAIRVVPLCELHHRAYDAHELDILHVLTLEEQVQAVRDAGGIELARKRLAPSLYRRES